MWHVKDTDSHGPIMDIAWRTRNSMMEPFHLLAARCDGSVSRWCNERSDVLENIVLNKNNEYMTLDVSSIQRMCCIAGSLPQVEIYDMEYMRLTQVIGE